MLETRRAKECQRGRAGAAERAKEGCEGLPEGSDTRLGARYREFESPHSDQNPSKSYDFDGFFFIIGRIIDKYWHVSGGLIAFLKPK